MNIWDKINSYLWPLQVTICTEVLLQVECLYKFFFSWYAYTLFLDDGRIEWEFLQCSVQGFSTQALQGDCQHIWVGYFAAEVR